MASELKSSRDALGVTLARLGSSVKDLVVLDADLSKSTGTICFGSKYPSRFFDVGCAEQNLVGTAAGLAIGGKIAVASTFAIFGSGRAWEQMRNVVAHDELDVKLMVSHGGLANGFDGSSHQALEDLALMRVIPNMSVIVPADYNEACSVVESAIKTKGPFYVRLSKIKTENIFDKKFKFKLGKVNVVKDGSDAVVFACGLLVHEALKARKLLAKDKISLRVVNVSSIKPLDVKGVLKHAIETGVVVSAEEHSIHGGLGGALAEVLCTENIPMKLIGVKDMFGQSGKHSELMKLYGLTAVDIAKSVKSLLKKK